MSNQRRSVDRESSKPRVSKKDPRPASPIFSEHEDDDEDVKHDLSANELDDSARPRVPSSQKKKNKNVKVLERKPAHAGNEDPKDVNSDVSDSDDFKIAPSLSILRGAAVHHEPETFEHTAHSQFIPSAHSFFMMLMYCQDLLLDNQYLRKILPGYNTLASSLYYSILFLLQILRARKLSCTITSEESKVLRTYERNFPFETLPVMGPLSGFFEMLGAVKLSDPRYTWVVPALPARATSTLASPSFANEGELLIPYPAILVAFCQEVAKAKKAGTDYLVDWKKGTTDTERLVKFGEIEFANAHSKHFYAVPGLSRFPDFREDFRSVNRFLKNCNFPPVTAATDLKPLENFMLASGNQSWFTHLIKHASIEADFFKGKTNMSKISPSSDLSMLVEMVYKDGDFLAPPTDDDTKTQDPFSHSESILHNFNHNINSFCRIVTTTTSQFQIGMSLAFIHHRVKDADGKSTDQKGSKSITMATSGPYFSGKTEQYPHTDNGFQSNSVIPISRVVEDHSPTALNFSSILVEHYFLEKGKKTKIEN